MNPPDAPPAPSAGLEAVLNDIHDLQARKTPSKRSDQVKQACLQCRKRKAKCDGARPNCARCAAAHPQTPCEYEFASGQTRQQGAAQRYGELQDRVAVFESVFEFLRTAPEAEAIETLRSIRKEGEGPIIRRLRLQNDPTAAFAAGSRQASVDSAGFQHQRSQAGVHDLDMAEPRDGIPGSPEEAALPGQDGSLPDLPALDLMDSSIAMLPTATSFGLPGLVFSNEFLTSTMGELNEPAPPGLYNINPMLPGSYGVQVPPSMYGPAMQQPEHGPVYTVPAQPWTSITDDATLISHLVTQFFSSCHPCWVLQIDRDAFLNAMKTKNRDSEFCSPLLVNALLGHACVVSRNVSALRSLGDLRASGRKFILEAERLLALEVGRATLTTLQSLTILAGYESTIGQPGNFQTYEDAFFKMYSDLDMSGWQEPDGLQDGHPFTINKWVTYSSIVWGSYTTAVMRALVNGRRVPLAAPKVMKPSKLRAAVDSYEPAWYAPDVIPLPERTFGLVFSCYCELMAIAAPCLDLTVSRSQPVPKDVAAQFRRTHKTLDAWRRALPAELKAETNMHPWAHLLKSYYDLIVAMLLRHAPTTE